MKRFLRSKLYRHLRLVAMSDWARKIIETILERLHKNPKLMPLRFQQMLKNENREIVIADYIASMTDRYAEKVHEGLTELVSSLFCRTHGWQDLGRS